MDQISNLPELIQALLPTDPISQAVLQHTRANLKEPIFNHSLRVYLLAAQLHERENSSESNTFTHPSGAVTLAASTPDRKSLFAACLFHDMGTSQSCNGPQRFEIEGADAAIKYLRSLGFCDENALHTIWCAITLHTSAGIAERIDPFTRLVRVAVKADFATVIRDALGLTNSAKLIEELLPRMHIESCLAETVVAQATRGEVEQGLYVANTRGRWTDSPKFPKASWPGVLLRGHLEKVSDEGDGWEGPNPAF